MSDKPKGIKEGPPIYVESLMTLQEWKERHKQFPDTSSQREPPSYTKEAYPGGKWRTEK